MTGAVFGEVVRGHRRRLGLTQEELATAAGLSVRSISKFESGRMAAPRMSTVRLLADVFGLAGTERERFCQVAVGVVSESGGAPSRAPAQLPPDIAVFAGRAQELEELDTMLAGAGSRTVLICAVSGPAGVGKTALAVHWAHRLRGRYPDGQLYVNLRGYDPAGAAVPPGEAIRQVLDAFGVPARRVPADLDGRISLYRTVLAGKRVLVVLDNARDAQQVLPLLPGSASLVLVTSRDRLTGLVAAHGARPLALDLLSTGEARELLARRLGGRRIAAEPEAVEAIIARCARLPLALAVAAARIDTSVGLSLASVAHQLRDSAGRLDALSTGDTPSTDVRAVLSWSYDTLGPDTARLLRLLGLHPGPDISVAAAASLAGLPPARTRSVLSELDRVHLVVEHVPGRYTLHDLLRAYAAERAHNDGAEREAAARRTLDHYVHSAYAADRLLSPYRDPIRLDHRLSLAYTRQALARQRELGDRRSEAFGWAILGNAHLHLAESRSAVACFERAHELLLEAGERCYDAFCLADLGAAHHATGDADRARDAWERALAVFERLHHPGADSVRLRLRHVDARPGPSDATELRGWWHPREDARGREVGAGSL